MHIVIDVDEEMIKYFAKHNCMNDDGWFSHSSKLLNAFRNGTPLPKGHGRLVDFSEVLIKLMQFYDGDKTIGQCLDEVNTIIEADKAESEG